MGVPKANKAALKKSNSHAIFTEPPNELPSSPELNNEEPLRRSTGPDIEYCASHPPRRPTQAQATDLPVRRRRATPSWPPQQPTMSQPRPLAQSQTQQQASQQHHHHGSPLLAQPLLILDGGLGTTLSQPPHNVNYSHDTTPMWSSHLLTTAQGREILLDVQRRFVRAGAQVLLTGTYQASLEGFGKTRREGGGEGIGEEEARGMMRGAVRVARQAFTREGLGREEGVVALGLGAYGATLVPSQEYGGIYGDGVGEQDLVRWHRRRLDVFLDEGKNAGVWGDVDVVAFETLPRVDEVRAVRRAMKGVDRPFWVTCVFPGEKDERGRYNLPDGSSVGELVEALLGGDEPKPWGVGINCVKIWKVKEIIWELEQAIREARHNKTRLVLYPDAAGNLVYDTSREEWVPEETKTGSGKTWEADMADIVRDVTETDSWTGVVAGGCCMAGPEQIEGLGNQFP